MADNATNLQLGLGVAGALGLGGILTKIIEAYYGKPKTAAEISKALAETDLTEAQTDRAAAETAKLRAETDALVRAAVAAQVQFIFDDHTKQREMDRRTIEAMEKRINVLEAELKKVEAELRHERSRRAAACGGSEKQPPFGVVEE